MLKVLLLCLMLLMLSYHASASSYLESQIDNCKYEVHLQYSDGASSEDIAGMLYECEYGTEESLIETNSLNIETDNKGI